MKRAAVSLFLTTIVALTGAARADGPTCTPSAERGAKATRLLGEMMRVATEAQWTDAATLRAKPGLDTVRKTPAAMRGAAALVRCDAAVLGADDRETMLGMATDAEKIAADLDAAVAAEDACRSTDKCMGDRVCEAVGGKQQALAWKQTSLDGIAREKANPSGVVDLARLHALGEDVQNAEAQARAADTEIAARKTQYTTARHKAFAAKCQ